MTRPPKLLLYTDASMYVKPEPPLGAWAAAAKVEGKPDLRRVAIFKAPPPSSTMAELWAITNGLHMIVEAGYTEPGQTVKVLGDNQVALKLVTGWRMTMAGVKRKLRPARERLHCAADVALAITKQHQLVIEAEWVPAHQPHSSDQHVQYNRWCDHNARERTKYERALLAGDQQRVDRLAIQYDASPICDRTTWL